MLRLCNRTPPHLRLRPPRPLSSSPSSSSASNGVKASKQTPPPTIPHHKSTIPTSLLRSPRTPLIALSATLVSAAVASYILLSGSPNAGPHSHRVYDDLRLAVERSSDSVNRILSRMKHTGAAASVLWQSLRSVLSSANHEVRSGFELRVASLLADIAAANASRRSAIVGAGSGAVMDWLLDTVAVNGDNSATQAEAARALAYLIADPNVCGAVLRRPHAVPNLLRFIFSCQPQHSKKSSRHGLLDLSGRSMLVTAIMDIVTSSCDSLDKAAFQPSLPVNAEMRDIATAIQVVEEGGMHFDESRGNEDGDDGDKGLRGIGIKVLGDTAVVGLSKTSGLLTLEDSDASFGEPDKVAPKTLSLQQKYDGPLARENASSVVPGLWDDLHCQHVAVPFAAWALANWAMASDVNRTHIQELDQDGVAIMTALMAPERTVKWHGSLVARLLLEDRNLPLNDSVSDWSSNLLFTISHASKVEDIPLAQMALSAFLISVERCSRAQKVVMDKGLDLMREAAKRTTKHKNVQEALAKALELLCGGDMHLSLQESQKWSGILLSWIFRSSSSETLQTSATNILFSVLEDHGPYSVPISQGWLALLLTEILDSRKATMGKGTQPESDKVKTQIDQSNIVSATQIANQLAATVVNLAGNQTGYATNSTDAFPLEDLLSLEPFAKPFKSLKKDNLPKSNAADSAVASLKGVKALTELCAQDALSQNRIADLGVLCLLRRFLIRDDYEKLAAIEAYDASRALEARDQVSKVDESEVPNPHDPSRVRVPPTAHIRKHAARLLMILSLLPKVQDVIVGDETWLKWLEDSANGKIPGCNDPKTQSYARATLINLSYKCKMNTKSGDGDASGGADCGSDGGSDGGAVNRKTFPPSYKDMIFLINPEQPHWRFAKRYSQYTGQRELHSFHKSPKDGDNDVDCLDEHVFRVHNGDSHDSVNASEDLSKLKDPLLDVVFVHGLRGGPYKTWRIADNKSSTKSGLVEKIDQEAGKHGTFWPGEWLSTDFPEARLFTLKYKTNLTQWSGASLPLQEVSSMLLDKLVAAGIGNRPVVFVTHSMGGLVVKQMLFKAKEENIDNLVNNTAGVVFYSCPHFGSKLADMPWRMGLVLRPAPTIGELRSGSLRLVELNDFIRHLHRKGLLEVLSFCETKVTPIVEGYGGWAFRMEIVPIESAYPGFGELVVLESTDHINSCKPISRNDPSYTEMLNFLRKLKREFT